MKRWSNECSPSLKRGSHLKLEALMCDSDSFPFAAVEVCTVVVCVHCPKAGWGNRPFVLWNTTDEPPWGGSHPALGTTDLPVFDLLLVSYF